MNGAAPPEGPHNIIVKPLDLVGDTYEPARTLRELGIARILGREITAWNNTMGSYGMGGPGFFGLHLAASGEYPSEWLVFAVWSADNWLLLDGQWVAAHSNQYHVQRPLTSDFGGDEDWDDLSGRLLDTVITRVEINAQSSRLLLEKSGKTHILEAPEDTSLLPLYGGTLTRRVWNPAQPHLDAWIISQSGDIII